MASVKGVNQQDDISAEAENFCFSIKKINAGELDKHFVRDFLPWRSSCCNTMDANNVNTASAAGDYNEPVFMDTFLASGYANHATSYGLELVYQIFSSSCLSIWSQLDFIPPKLQNCVAFISTWSDFLALHF